jgi:hypothetical protein
LNVPVNSPPDRNPLHSNVLSFLVAIEGGGSAPLPVADSSKISAELEGDVPMANTPSDRVALWLRRHRDLITKDAAERKIPAEAIAGAVAWEGLQNVTPVNWKAEGPGKVHWDFGSAADQVEQMGYLPVVDVTERLKRVQDADWALRCVSIDKKLIPGGPFFEPIGVNQGQTAIRPLNARAYFLYKSRTGDIYKPNAEMGDWVQKNLTYLNGALR